MSVSVGLRVQGRRPVGPQHPQKTQLGPGQCTPSTVRRHPKGGRTRRLRAATAHHRTGGHGRGRGLVVSMAAHCMRRSVQWAPEREQPTRTARDRQDSPGAHAVGAGSSPNKQPGSAERAARTPGCRARADPGTGGRRRTCCRTDTRGQQCLPCRALRAERTHVRAPYDPAAFQSNSANLAEDSQ